MPLMNAACLNADTATLNATVWISNAYLKMHKAATVYPWGHIFLRGLRHASKGIGVHARIGSAPHTGSHAATTTPSWLAPL
jgi:hypothetical protein